MTRALYLIAILLTVQLVHAQVGFNNKNPDPSSILDLTANDKGLLIPRLTTAEREAIKVSNAPARSLMVFDVTLGTFCYYDGIKWYLLNEWIREAGSTSVASAGNVTVNGSLQVSGTVTAPDYALNATGNGPVPKGAIVMWSGSISNIPTGWALCDGNNFTPNLRDRFIVGAGSTYGVGNTGGAATVTLTAAQSGLPAHDHQINDPGHTHSTPRGTSEGFGSYFSEDTGTSTGSKTTGLRTTGITIRNNTAQNATQAHENRPPYFALAYIMKL